MSNGNWWNNGNERLHSGNNNEEDHDKVTLILHECHVPATLEARTLQAMSEWRSRQASGKSIQEDLSS